MPERMKDIAKISEGENCRPRWSGWGDCRLEILECGNCRPKVWRVKNKRRESGFILTKPNNGAENEVRVLKEKCGLLISIAHPGQNGTI